MTERYYFTNGWYMARELDHPYRWVLVNEIGLFQDRDQYRNDIINRYNLEVAQHINDPF